MKRFENSPEVRLTVNAKDATAKLGAGIRLGGPGWLGQIRGEIKEETNVI
jgi:hypothetical protein